MSAPPRNNGAVNGEQWGNLYLHSGEAYPSFIHAATTLSSAPRFYSVPYIFIRAAALAWDSHLDSQIAIAKLRHRRVAFFTRPCFFRHLGMKCRDEHRDRYRAGRIG
jgi:hypothetical protein